MSVPVTNPVTSNVILSAANAFIEVPLNVVIINARHKYNTARYTTFLYLSKSNCPAPPFVKMTTDTISMYQSFIFMLISIYYNDLTTLLLHVPKLPDIPSGL